MLGKLYTLFVATVISPMWLNSFFVKLNQATDYVATEDLGVTN